ncbi:MAG: 50S ribosomal protein L3 [Patescibacteria group bacterium]|jgi:large subunit ribosomal protein L3
MKFISGKKLSMTQIWSGDEVLAVTPVLAGPCVVTQVKTKAKDGYNALQFAYGTRKEKNINKPQRGHFAKAGVKPAHVCEFRTEEAANFKVGDVVNVETFSVGDTINVTGTSKGKGFQGVVKRHHFAGFRKTHGNKDQERMPGSIGPKGPAHVFKGTRMAGRMGGERVTVTNLEVAAIDAENNILFVKGAVPGAINGFLTIQGSGDLQVNLKKTATEPIVEEKAVEPEIEIKAETAEVKAEPVGEVVEEVKVEEAKAEEAKTEEAAS